MTSQAIDRDLQGVRALVLAGEFEAARTQAQALAAAVPAAAEPHYWLASACLGLGDGPSAALHLNDAAILHGIPVIRESGVDLVRCRSDADYAARVAQSLYAQGHVALSSVVWGMTLGGQTPHAPSFISYGLSLLHQGRIDQAVEVFRASGELFDTAAIGQFLLFPLLFCNDGGRAYAQEAMAWARRFARGGGGEAAAPPLDGKLHIGYVAPRFASNQLKQFIAPLLRNHDPEKVRVTLYPETEEPEGDWPNWIAVKPIGGLSAAAAAEMIRGDQVHVLADCWGHTAGSRLEVFAFKPAPVQVAWLNFVQTTGLPQMDYVLHASSAIGLSDLDLFAEAVCDVGPVFTAFEPSPDRPPPADTPALANGYITFASFNHPAKLSASVVEAWSQVLQGEPTSRLLLKYRYFVDPVLQRSVRARFAAFGVAPERILFEGHSSGADYHQSFARVDLALDTWPAPGSTTTLEALSHGVPVLSLGDETLTGAYAASIARASGLPELVAAGRAEFVERAIELTRDPASLNALRARVRPAFEQGPICDGAGFTRRIERLFADLVAGRSAAAPATDTPT